MDKFDIIKEHSGMHHCTPKIIKKIKFLKFPEHDIYDNMALRPLGGVVRPGLKGVWVHHYGEWFLAFRKAFDEHYETDMFVHVEMYLEAK